MAQWRKQKRDPYEALGVDPKVMPAARIFATQVYETFWPNWMPFRARMLDSVLEGRQDDSVGVIVAAYVLTLNLMRSKC